LLAVVVCAQATLLVQPGCRTYDAAGQVGIPHRQRYCVPTGHTASRIPAACGIDRPRSAPWAEQRKYAGQTREDAHDLQGHTGTTQARRPSERSRRRQEHFGAAASRSRSPRALSPQCCSSSVCFAPRNLLGDEAAAGDHPALRKGVRGRTVASAPKRTVSADSHLVEAICTGEFALVKDHIRQD